jgi:two-component system phosphate regulon sensor histidine kinase PhoR
MAHMSGLVAGSEDSQRGFRRIIALLIWLVIVPTGALLALAILMLIFSTPRLNLLFGILTMGLVGCFVTGAVLALVFLRREANLSKLQLDFVSKVSHELRTPLTSIRMFVEMLQHDDRTEEETATCLSVLMKETTRLTDRIERLLDWGRMEAGRRVYEHKTEAVEDVVTASLEAFKASTVGLDYNVTVDIDGGIPELIADRSALVDAMVNLLSNAVKYSGDEPELNVTATCDPRFVRLSVTDKGIGIPLDEHKLVFQKFYRVNELLSHDVGGSGLGLAIVRHVATAHRGHVELESAPGEGATFTIVLPRPTEKQLLKAATSADADA